MEERKGQTWTKETGVANKVEREKPRKNLQKLASLAFSDFSEVFPFPLYWPPLFPLFRFGLSSLPCFFLSLFIVYSFLPSLQWFFLCLLIVHHFLPSLPLFFPSLFIVHAFLPSLPWFLLYLFVVHPFLLWSPALAVQSLPLAHRSSPLDPRHPIQTIQSCPPKPLGARDRARPLMDVTKLCDAFSAILRQICDELM